MGGDKHANLVVHRVTAAVTRDSRYVEWASKFDEKTEVRTIARSIYSTLPCFLVRYSKSSPSLMQSTMLSHTLQVLGIFFDSTCSTRTFSSRRSSKSWRRKGLLPVGTLPRMCRFLLIRFLHAKVERAKPAQAYQTMKMYPPAPLRVLSHSGADPNYPESAAGQEASQQRVLEQMPRYADALRTLESASAPAPELQPEDYGITVTPFGTGSAIPSKYRNGESRAGYMEQL